MPKKICIDKVLEFQRNDILWNAAYHRPCPSVFTAKHFFMYNSLHYFNSLGHLETALEPCSSLTPLHHIARVNSETVHKTYLKSYKEDLKEKP